MDVPRAAARSYGTLLGFYCKGIAMLVLSRKRNESVFLIDKSTGSIICEVTLTEKDISRNREIHIGFSAPENIQIVRSELVGVPARKGDAK